MNYIDKDKLKEALDAISLSNEDLTRFGDGFEKAIELVYAALDEAEVVDIINK